MKINGLILFGDSVYFGYGASQKNFGCGRLLKSRFNFPIIIKAKNNVTSREALRRIANDVLSYDSQLYSHVIVLFGNNDCRLVAKDVPDVGLEEYSLNLTRIISHILSNGKKCFLSNLQPIENNLFFQFMPDVKSKMSTIQSPYSWHKQYSNACSEIAERCRIPLIDIRTPLEGATGGVFYDDGLHPNDEGHRIICDTIQRSVKKYLEEITQ